MNPDVAFGVQLVVTIIVGGFLWNHIRFQGQKIDRLNSMIEKQSVIINDFEKLRALFNSSHLEEIVSMRLHHRGWGFYRHGRGSVIAGSYRALSRNAVIHAIR